MRAITEVTECEAGGWARTRVGNKVLSETMGSLHFCGQTVQGRHEAAHNTDQTRNNKYEMTNSKYQTRHDLKKNITNKR